MSRSPFIIAGAVLLAVGLGAGVAAVLVRIDTNAPVPQLVPIDQTRPVAEATDPQLGRRIYARCQACHGLDGHGVAGNYPPLAGSAMLAASDPAPAIRLVLIGVLRSEHWNGYMPPFADQLDDTDIAAVLSWVRSQWGNHAAPLGAADVARVRR